MNLFRNFSQYCIRYIQSWERSLRSSLAQKYMSALNERGFLLVTKHYLSSRSAKAFSTHKQIKDGVMMYFSVFIIRVGILKGTGETSSYEKNA